MMAWLAGLILVATPADWASVEQRTVALLEQNRPAEAIRICDEALRRAEAEFGSTDPRVGYILRNLARAYRAGGVLKKSEAAIRRSITAFTGAFGDRDANVALGWGSLGGILLDQGRNTEGAAALERAIDIGGDALGAHLATLLNDLGAARFADRRFAEAENLFRRSLAIREAELGSHHPYVARSLANLARACEANKRGGEAKALRERSRSILTADFRPR